MEVYKRTIGYEEIGRTTNLIIIATTFNFPFLLKQSFEDIGIYTDTDNPVFELVDLSGIWNTSNNGLGQKPCLNLNNCNVTINETPITFFGANNGALSAIVSSCPTPQTYQWTGPNGFNSTNLYINSLVSGNYTLKVTDANCDITYASYFLQQPQGLSFNILTTNSQTNANFGCNGTASVQPQGGQPPYTFLWYSGTTSNILNTTSGMTGLCAGLYAVQITDSSGTIVSSIFTITQPSALSGTVVTTTNIDCGGASTGSMTIQGIGGYLTTGYTYNMTGPVTTTNVTGIFNGLPSGSYNIQIVDNAGATFNLPVVLTQPVAVTYGYSLSNITCFNSVNGSISINPVGGSGVYDITLTKTSTPTGTIGSVHVSGPYTFNGLYSGTYNISIVDTTGCVGPTTSITLTRRPLLNILYTASTLTNGYNIACFGDDITIPFNTTYTSGTFTSAAVSNLIKYYINGVLTTSCTGIGCGVNLTLSAGTNTITAVDAFNCSATTVTNITQPPMPLSITTGLINSTTGTTCTGCTINNCRQGIIDINGGVAPYVISWTDGSTLLTSNSHCIGTALSVTVTDDNGCIVGPTPITLSP